MSSLVDQDLPRSELLGRRRAKESDFSDQSYNCKKSIAKRTKRTAPHAHVADRPGPPPASAAALVCGTMEGGRKYGGYTPPPVVTAAAVSGKYEYSDGGGAPVVLVPPPSASAPSVSDLLAPPAAAVIGGGGRWHGGGDHRPGVLPVAVAVPVGAPPPPVVGGSVMQTPVYEVPPRRISQPPVPRFSGLAAPIHQPAYDDQLVPGYSVLARLLHTRPPAQMFWDCRSCHTRKLLGKTHRHCPICGAPQQATDRYFPADHEKVAAQDHLYYGADLVCSRCQAPNCVAARHCFHCGEGLADTTVAAAQQVETRPSELSFSFSNALLQHGWHGRRRRQNTTDSSRSSRSSSTWAGSYPSGNNTLCVRYPCLPRCCCADKLPGGEAAYEYMTCSMSLPASG
jgi:ribosomal protein L40E